MSLFSRLLQVVDSWRTRRGGPKTAKRAGIAIEHLDHRRLLTVNFTGNVPADFPATTTPGVAIIQDANPVDGYAMLGNLGSPTSLPPSPAYSGPVYTSGFNIKDIRVTYTPSDDTLSIGLDGPPASAGSTNEVIAGDADSNGNSATFNPSILGFPGNGNFQDPFDFSKSEHMGVTLNFLPGSTTIPQVVAGYPASTPVGASVKTYEVALGTGAFDFATALPQFTGNVYTVNSPSNPNLEFSIKNFSQLYNVETGSSLTPAQLAASNAQIAIGGFGGSGDDGVIGEATVTPQTFSITTATPIVPPVNPPPSPPILINPHEHRIIDTLHRDLVRVSIFGTSGFPVSQINPATVELEGVKAIAHITRKVHRNEFPFQTYVFVADQLNLPAGLTTATLTGQLKSGVTFTSQKDVLNLPHSALAFGKLKKYMGNASYYERLAKLEAKNPSIVNSVSGTPAVAVSRNSKAQGAAAIKVEYTPKVAAAGTVAKAESAKVRPVVSLKRAEAAHAKSRLSTRVRHSMNHFLSAAG